MLSFYSYFCTLYSNTNHYSMASGLHPLYLLEAHLLGIELAPNDAGSTEVGQLPVEPM